MSKLIERERTYIKFVDELQQDIYIFICNLPSVSFSLVSIDYL
jgi:hypothetical protein